MSIPHARYRSRIVDLLHAKTRPAGRRRYRPFPAILHLQSSDFGCGPSGPRRLFVVNSVSPLSELDFGAKHQTSWWNKHGTLPESILCTRTEEGSRNIIKRVRVEDIEDVRSHSNTERST